MTPDDRIYYSIAFSVRSGSSEICNILTKLGLGAPTEYFQQMLCPDAETLAFWVGGFNEMFADFVSGNSIGRIFGSKLSYDQRAQIEGEIRFHNPGVSTLGAYWPNHRWIWLKRRDKIAQAISLCKAETFGVWHELAGARSSADRELEYDYVFIFSRILQLCSYDLTWEIYFERYQEVPLVVYYEDFFSDPEQHLARIVEFLGIDPSDYPLADAISQTCRVLRNQADDAVRERFISDLLDVGAPGWGSGHWQDLENWGNFFRNKGWRVNAEPSEQSQDSELP